MNINANGATNIQYSLDGGTWQTSSTFANLSAGTYTLQTRNADVVSCTSSTQQATLTDPTTPTVTITKVPDINELTCSEGTTTLTAV